MEGLLDPEVYLDEQRWQASLVTDERYQACIAALHARLGSRDPDHGLLGDEAFAVFREAATFMCGSRAAFLQVGSGAPRTRCVIS